MSSSIRNNEIKVFTNGKWQMVTPEEARKIQAAKLRMRIVHLQKRLDLLLNNGCKQAHSPRESW
jgi:hypothetical protein